eukprot:jgi/Tetstr1/457858/TSEL_004260.t1
MPGAQADDEEELELNYEENDNAMDEVDTTQELHHLTTAATEMLAQSSPASQPAIAANVASLAEESHQLRNPQHLSIQPERHPSQPTPAGKGKAATTQEKQPRGRSRSDGATRNRSRSKPRLSGTRGSDSDGTVFALHKDDSAASEERAKSGDPLRVRPLGVGSVLVRLDSAHALPYLSSINGFYRDNGAEPVAQGDLINKFTAVSADCQQPGAATAAYAIGVVLRKVKNFGGWAQLSRVVLDYINPTELPCAASWKLFG